MTLEHSWFGQFSENNECKDGSGFATDSHSPVDDPSGQTLGEASFEARISSQNLAEIIRKTGFCANLDGTAQIHLVFTRAKVKAVTTNRFTMASCQLRCSANLPSAFTVPLSALQACKAMTGPITVEALECGPNGIGVFAFSDSKCRVLARAMGQFPDFQKMVIAAEQTIEFWLPDLRNAFRTMAKRHQKRSGALVRVRLTTDKRTIKLEGARLMLQVPFSRAMNDTFHRGVFFIDPNLVDKVLRKFPRKGKVRLDFSGMEKPIRLSVEAMSYEIVIMPFRPPEDFQVQTFGQKS